MKYILILLITVLSVFSVGVSSAETDKKNSKDDSVSRRENIYGSSAAGGLTDVVGDTSGSVYDDYVLLEMRSRNMTIREIMEKASEYFRRRNDLDKGALWLRVAISRYRDDMTVEEKNECATAYTNLAYFWIFERNNPFEAYPLLIKCLKIAETGDIDANTVAATYTNIGRIYTVFKDYGKAMDFYRKAFATASSTNHSVAIPYSFTDLIHFAWCVDSLQTVTGEIYMMRKQGKSGLSMSGYAGLMADAAESRLRGDLRRSVALVDSALATLDPLVDDRRYFVFNRIISTREAVRTGDYAKAFDNLQMSGDIIKEGNLQDMYALYYKEKEEYHLAIGDKAGAEACVNEALRFTDSLHNVQSYGQIRDIEASWRAGDYDEKLSLSRSETRKWILFASVLGALVLLILAMLVYILRRNRTLRQRNERLFRKNVELLEARADLRNASKRSVAVAPVSSEETDTDAENSSSREQDSDAESNDDGSDALQSVFDKVRGYMDNGGEIFDPAFTIDTLSRNIGVRSRLISRAVNSIAGKNFNTLLGEYRIHEACRRMLSVPTHGDRPTLEVLAAEVGYRSRTHFMRVFKQVTGLTTTEFLRQAERTSAESIHEV